MNNYVVISVDTGGCGIYHYLYKDGFLVDEKDGQPEDGWYDIPWTVVLKILKIPFGHIVFTDDVGDLMPYKLKDWY